MNEDYPTIWEKPGTNKYKWGIISVIQNIKIPDWGIPIGEDCDIIQPLFSCGRGAFSYDRNKENLYKEGKLILPCCIEHRWRCHLMFAKKAYYL